MLCRDIAPPGFPAVRPQAPGGSVTPSFVGSDERILGPQRIIAIVATLAEDGVPPARTLANSGLTEEALRVPAMRVSSNQIATVFIYFLMSAAVYALLFWVPTLIRTWGVTDLFQLGLLKAVPSIIGMVGMVLM